MLVDKLMAGNLGDYKTFLTPPTKVEKVRLPQEPAEDLGALNSFNG
jgi:hypothetical protein